MGTMVPPTLKDYGYFQVELCILQTAMPISAHAFKNQHFTSHQKSSSTKTHHERCMHQPENQLQPHACYIPLASNLPYLMRDLLPFEPTAHTASTRA